MGITKIPMNCTDEIIPFYEVNEFDEPAYYSSSSDNESIDAFPLPLIQIINSSDYYRHHFPELIANINENVDFDKINDDITASLKKKKVSHIGRRKLNRAQNENFLLSLNNDQYLEDEIFVNDNKNGFTKLMKKLCTRPDLQKMFIGGKDILQKKKEYYNDRKSKRSICPNMAFNNLTMSQKSIFKQKSLPVTAIDRLETEVVEFFSRLPNGIFMSAPLNSYNRILLHSIVRYYSLNATSMNSRSHRSHKIIQIRNDQFDNFQPPRMSLLKFALSLNC